MRTLTNNTPAQSAYNTNRLSPPNTSYQRANFRSDYTQLPDDDDQNGKNTASEPPNSCAPLLDELGHTHIHTQYARHMNQAKENTYDLAHLTLLVES